jgi:uncharacterized surface protein with fasciclin (FAS1) repeats
MKSRTSIFVLALAALLLGLAVPAQAQMAEKAMIRVAHFAVDAPAVDVFVNGEAAITNLPYPEVTQYLALEPGTYSVAVAPTGSGIDAAVIGPVELEFAAGASYTVAATGQLADSTFGPLVINDSDQRTALDLAQGSSTITILHAISNAPAVDIYANDALILENVPFNAYATIAAPSEEVTIKITATGSPETVVVETPWTAYAGTDHLVAAVGTMTDNNFRLAQAVTSPLNAVEWLAAQANNGMSRSFNTLLAAATAADLGGALSGTGPLTIFAPNDDAFAALPEGTVEGLLADVPALTSILTYHVVDGLVARRDVVASLGANMGNFDVTTLNGSPFTVTAGDNAVTINDANLFETDIFVSNGVIHTMNGVILPPAAN